MVFDDLRSYVDYLESIGELLKVRPEVDWDQEVGAIADEAINRQGPALLFENMKDCAQGRLLTNTNMTSRRRVYAALNIPEETHPLDAIRIWQQRLRKPVAPVMVQRRDAPCKQIIKYGSDINLYEFGAPKWHARDGGRYIQTYGGVVTRDPESGWQNVGVYRGMISGRDEISVLMIPTQHWGLHAAKWAKLGKPMPVAITAGNDPICPYVFSMPLDAGICEYDIVGAMREKPLALVKCETVDLEVPAHAELVIEGEISMDPSTFRLEGPFGEYAGYYTTLDKFPRPVMKVKCVTHRPKPIIQGFYAGVAERYPQGKPCCFLETVPLLNLLESQGIPGIKGVYGMDASETSHTIVVVSIDKVYDGQPHQIAAALWGSTFSSMIGKFVVVVDSDIDITNPHQVLQAIAHRVRPGEDMVTFKGTMGGPLDPINHPDVMRATNGLGRWDRVLIDATWPLSWAPRDEWGGERHPPKIQPEAEVLARVRERWHEYGFKG